MRRPRSPFLLSGIKTPEIQRRNFPSHVAGFNPVFVMDVWEHAFILDYKPAERPKYIEAFFSNIDWHAVEARLKHSATQHSVA
jgi:superoxide dismutase